MKTKVKNNEAPIVETRKRITICAVSLILILAFLMFNIFKLQYFNYEHYKAKVYDQVTTSTPLPAARGTIYDRTMNILATDETSWRIFISTRDIKKAEKNENVSYSEMIANGLANILSLDANRLLIKIKNSNVLDVTVKKSASRDEYEAVLLFIKQHGLERLIFTEATTTRYYPEGTMLSHVLGFTGSDNQGLYGLEYYYNSELSGKDGYYLYAKDANGNALDTEYSNYVNGEDGYSLITTIDSYLQKELEAILESAVKNHAVENRACGIVMDTSSGAILAMATTSPFDPNSPYVLDEKSQIKLSNSGFDENSEEYKAYKRELMEIMWSNKAVSETYEPGSTFKIITVSAALDLGIAKITDQFSCKGYHEVGGWRIKCHKTTGHGSGFSLAYGLQMSCNPTMMKLSEKIGAEAFYSYVEKFGYFEKSGIDLPSEARTIFHKPDAIGVTELATASFGQRFKVSIINHLRAISAVANGGYLVEPYIVDKIIDKNGNVISQHSTVKERIIEENTAKLISSVLEEGVSGDGGAKNARVSGYKVAAKTGTSQKFDILDENGNSYLRIGSTVAYAPSDENGIAVIIVIDEPTSSIKYGSVVAAPYVSKFLEKALPYLDYTSTEEKDEYEIPNYVGLSLKEASENLKASGLAYEIVGQGNYVLYQTPSAGDSVNMPNTIIILYTEEPTDLLSVPALVGLAVSDAIRLAVNSGLNVRLHGSVDIGKVVSQSIPVGALVKKGSVIDLEILIYDYED